MIPSDVEVKTDTFCLRSKIIILCVVNLIDDDIGGII